MAEAVAAGVEAHARAAADRRLHVGAAEADALRRNAVDVRGADGRMTGVSEVIVAELVRHDEEDVRLSHDLAPAGLRATGSAPGFDQAVAVSTDIVGRGDRTLDPAVGTRSTPLRGRRDVSPIVAFVTPGGRRRRVARFCIQ